MAKFEEILEQHKESLQGKEGLDKTYNDLNSTLSELGYEVLINNKKEAEFVPSSRFSQVVSQKNEFEKSVKDLNDQLEKMKTKDDSEINSQIEQLQSENQKLIDKMNATKIDAEVLVLSTDAHNPKDILALVDKSKIKMNSKGEVTGVQEEIDRIKQDKPYLFRNTQSSAGTDRTNSEGQGNTGFDMNAALRKAMFRG